LFDAPSCILETNCEDDLSKVDIIFVAENPGKDDTRFILSFRVGNIEEAHRNLAARCGEIAAIRHHPWGARLFELRDPEKRRLEFWTPQ